MNEVILQIGGTLILLFSSMTIMSGESAKELVFSKSQNDSPGVSIQKHTAWYDPYKQAVVPVLEWDAPVNITAIRMYGSLRCQKCKGVFSLKDGSKKLTQFVIDWKDTSMDNLSEYLFHFKDNSFIKTNYVGIEIFIDHPSSVNELKIDNIDVVVLPERNTVYEVTFYTANVTQGETVSAPTLILIDSANKSTSLSFKVEHFHKGSSLTRRVIGERLDIQKVMYTHADTDVWHLDKIVLRDQSIQYTCQFNMKLDLLSNNYKKTVNCVKEIDYNHCPFEKRKLLFDLPTRNGPCRFPFLHEGRASYSCISDSSSSQMVCPAACHLNATTKRICTEAQKVALPIASLSVSSSPDNGAQGILAKPDKQHSCIKFNRTSHKNSAYFIADMGNLKEISTVRILFDKKLDGKYPNLKIGRYLDENVKSSCEVKYWSSTDGLDSDKQGIDYLCGDRIGRFIQIVDNSSFSICRLSIFKKGNSGARNCFDSSRQMELCYRGSTGILKLFRNDTASMGVLDSTWIGDFESAKSINAIALTGVSKLPKPDGKLLVFGEESNGRWTLCGDFTKHLHSYRLINSGFMSCERNMTVIKLKIVHKHSQLSNLLKIWTIVYHENNVNNPGAVTTEKSKVLRHTQSNGSWRLRNSRPFLVILSLFLVIIHF